MKAGGIDKLDFYNYLNNIRLRSNLLIPLKFLFYLVLYICIYFSLFLLQIGTNLTQSYFIIQLTVTVF